MSTEIKQISEILSTSQPTNTDWVFPEPKQGFNFSDLFFEFLKKNTKWHEYDLDKLKKRQCKLNYDQAAILIRKAAMLGNSQIIKEILEYLAYCKIPQRITAVKLHYLNTTNPEGNTALMLAAVNGHQECFALLLAEGASIYKINKQRKSALVLAAEKNRSNILKFFFQESRGIQYYDEYGNSLLENLIEQNRMDLAQQLIENGLNINVCLKCPENELWNINGVGVPEPNKALTPLVRAIRAQNVELVIGLLQLKADPNQSTLSGDLPLLEAFPKLSDFAGITDKNIKYKKLLKMLQVLLDFGAGTNSNEYNALALLNYNLILIREILQDSKRIESNDYWGVLKQILLKDKVDPLKSLSDQHESFLLGFITSYARFKVESTNQSEIKFLYEQLAMVIKSCKDIDRVDHFYHMTAFAYASRFGLPEIVELLIKQGASPLGIYPQPFNFANMLKRAEYIWRSAEWPAYSEPYDSRFFYGQTLPSKPKFDEMTASEDVQLCRQLISVTQNGHQILCTRVRTLVFNELYSSLTMFPPPILRIIQKLAENAEEEACGFEHDFMLQRRSIA